MSKDQSPSTTSTPGKTTVVVVGQVEEAVDDEEEVVEEDAEAAKLSQEDINASEERRKEEVLADAEAENTFPLVQNEFVEKWNQYHHGRGRQTFKKWMERSTRYIPLMRQILKEEGLPEDLIYLAMIESGFNTSAKSRAKAVGPWQFISSTGSRYGMYQSFWVDERRDFIKSTRAAAKYLRELNQIFKSWYLAAAAYNGGEGRVLTAVRKYQTRNFWELVRKKDAFRAETRNYVPKIISAALVSKNPAAHGFQDLEFHQPMTWVNVDVPSGLKLKDISNGLEMSFEELKLLNPELKQEMTPPLEQGQSAYSLRIPPETKEKMIALLPSLKPQKLGPIIEYSLRNGDNLGRISRRFGVPVAVIMDFNKLKDARRLRAGRVLLIPTKYRN